MLWRRRYHSFRVGASSSDLNLTVNVWDTIGQCVAARHPPSLFIPELRIALIQEWDGLLQKQIKNLALSMARLYGKEDVKDEPCSGRPPTSTTPDNIERVRRMLADDRRLSLRMIAEELKISLDSVSNIIHEHLQKRKKNVYAFPTLLRFSNV
ncbi:hypothetical protein AVEN_254349-1 [Araneus ventricosus]|uniref:Uncharacterized protein n=1 Tax=Araneus ventricosus TaxID=182803 RepID=A0A4Y2SSQ7_ARAVE|nr:hypothetical protein AVEN_254349-1 [Araneus ventricosus]